MMSLMKRRAAGQTGASTTRKGPGRGTSAGHEAPSTSWPWARHDHASVDAEEDVRILCYWQCCLCERFANCYRC
jgi:hypothetical protein